MNTDFCLPNWRLFDIVVGFGCPQQKLGGVATSNGLTHTIRSKKLIELLVCHKVRIAHIIFIFFKKGDFQVGIHTFEVGGSKKGSKQIAALENAYILADDTLVGFGNKIPIWLFGFLY